MKIEILCDELDFLEPGFKKKNPEINDQIELEKNAIATITNKTTMRGGIFPQFLVEISIHVDFGAIGGAVSEFSIGIISGLISTWLYELLKQIKHKKTRLTIEGRSVEIDPDKITQRIIRIIEEK